MVQCNLKPVLRFEMAVDAAFGALAWKYGIELQVRLYVQRYGQ